MAGTKEDAISAGEKFLSVKQIVKDKATPVDATKMVRVKKERGCPHISLLKCAEYYLNTAKASEYGRHYNLLGAILFSALSIEAIGNTYGELLINDWNIDFESARPRAKLRLIANSRGIKTDFGRDPWLTANRLIWFRNRFAHAKPEYFRTVKECKLVEYRNGVGPKLETVETMINAPFATKSYKAIREILEILNKTLTERELNLLTYDGRQYEAEIK